VLLYWLLIFIPLTWEKIKMILDTVAITVSPNSLIPHSKNVLFTVYDKPHSSNPHLPCAKIVPRQLVCIQYNSSSSAFYLQPRASSSCLLWQKIIPKEQRIWLAACAEIPGFLLVDNWRLPPPSALPARVARRIQFSPWPDSRQASESGICCGSPSRKM
jgi:hypothetical protein